MENTNFSSMNQLHVWVLFLAIEHTSKKWTIPIANWRMTMNRFIIQCGERLQQFI